MWMLSTKMMPAVGVLVPIYLIFKDLHLLDTIYGLIIIYMLMNLPIVAWMLYSFFKDVPKEILEAARMDGARPLQQIDAASRSRWRCRASSRRRCSRSSCAGTRRSGASISPRRRRAR